mgnify:CR=1 FL=1
MKLKNEIFAFVLDWLVKNKGVDGQKGLSQITGISQNTVSRIMTGKVEPSDDTLRKLNDAFGGIFNMNYLRGISTVMFIEDEMYYAVFCDGAKVAEAKLKAKGPAVTKLAILSYREWNVEYLKPFIEKCDYSLRVPTDFKVKVNGMELETKENTGNGEVEYVVEGVYFAPEFEIKDGVLVKYKGDNKDIVIPEGVTHIGEKAFYNCSFIESITIPKSLKSIGEKAFSGDTNYNNWVDHDSYNRIYRTNLSKINITDVAAWCNIDFGDATLAFKNFERPF